MKHFLFGGCGCLRKQINSDPFGAWTVMGYVVLERNGQNRFINASFVDAFPFRVDARAPVSGIYTFFGAPAAGQYEVLGTHAAGTLGWFQAVEVTGGQIIRFYSSPFSGTQKGDYGLWVKGPAGFDSAAYVARILG